MRQQAHGDSDLFFEKVLGVVIGGEKVHELPRERLLGKERPAAEAIGDGVGGNRARLGKLRDQLLIKVPTISSV